MREYNLPIKMKGRAKRIKDELWKIKQKW